MGEELLLLMTLLVFIQRRLYTVSGNMLHLVIGCVVYPFCVCRIDGSMGENKLELYLFLCAAGIHLRPLTMWTDYSCFSHTLFDIIARHSLQAYVLVRSTIPRPVPGTWYVPGNSYCRYQVPNTGVGTRYSTGTRTQYRHWTSQWTFTLHDTTLFVEPAQLLIWTQRKSEGFGDVLLGKNSGVK